MHVVCAINNEMDKLKFFKSWQLFCQKSQIWTWIGFGSNKMMPIPLDPNPRLPLSCNWSKNRRNRSKRNKLDTVIACDKEWVPYLRDLFTKQNDFLFLLCNDTCFKTIPGACLWQTSSNWWSGVSIDLSPARGERSRAARSRVELKAERSREARNRGGLRGVSEGRSWPACSRVEITGFKAGRFRPARSREVSPGFRAGSSRSARRRRVEDKRVREGRSLAARCRAALKGTREGSFLAARSPVALTELRFRAARGRVELAGGSRPARSRASRSASSRWRSASASWLSHSGSLFSSHSARSWPRICAFIIFVTTPKPY